MIRQPTPASQIYALHRAAIAGKYVPLHESDPFCGWFKTRMVRGGPFVPASVSLSREIDEHGELASDETMICEINGEPRDPYSAWLSICRHPISRAEYLELKELQARHPEMAATHAPIRLSAGSIRP